MSNKEFIPCTISELGFLWTGYSINQMSEWFLTAFREHTKDEDMKNLYSFVLQQNIEIVNKRKKILNEEGYPLADAFSEKDIDSNSPSLFSDRFLLCYLHIGARLGLEFHSRSLALSTRADIRQYHSDCLNSAISIYEKVVDLLLNKGIYWRPPALFVPPSTSEVVQKSSYLSGWFGDTRTINTMEAANLYLIIDIILIIEALSIGFSQTSDSNEAIEIFQKGTTVARKQYHVLAKLLMKDELPIPPSYSAEVAGSKKRIFSDRIMVNHLAGLFGTLLSQYGFSLGTAMNHELVTAYSTQIIKAGAYSEKITKFLIDKKWLDKVPSALSRNNR